MKNKLFLFVSLTMLYSCQEPLEYVRWNFQTGDRVYAHPLIIDNEVFAGSNDSSFYCLDAITGAKKWSYRAGNSIQSSSAAAGDRLFFEAGNTFYALNRNTGEEIWAYSTDDPEAQGKIDPWDYHHANPIVDDSLVYFACGNGHIYGLDIQQGILEVLIQAIDSAAIRSTPAIDDGIIYFGDWNGIVYAYSIALRDTLWTKRTYDTQPYSTFGMVNTQMLVYDSLLIFGARNPEIQVLSKNTGKVIWSYAVPTGGWISGDPLVHKDTLYIGGSDSHQMYAFNAYTGTLYWDYEFLYNNFSKPQIAGDQIVFTTGNAYAYEGTNYGTGYIYGLKRSDGSLHNFERIGGNLFTTPSLNNGLIIVGSSDGSLYAIDSAMFFENPVGLQEKGYRSVSFNDLTPNPFTDTIQIAYSVEYPSEIFLNVISFDGNELATLYTGEQSAGKHIFSWDGRNDNGEPVPSGYLLLELGSDQYRLTEIVLKK